MKKLINAIVLMALFATCLPSSAGAADTQPYEVHVILPLTGFAAFIGHAAAQDFQLIVGDVNRHGGIKGRPLKFVIADDQSNPQIAVQLANDITAQHVPVIIGPQFTSTCLAVAPLVVKSGPVMYCLAPSIHPTRGGYVFSASMSISDDVSALVRYFRLRGWKRIGFITTTDAGGQEMERSLDNALSLPENAGVTITGRQYLNQNDITANAQLARLKTTNPQALIAWATGTPNATLLRGIRDTGIDLPIGASSGNMTYAQMKQSADYLPAQMYFPGLAPLGRGSVGKGPIADAQATYFKDFESIGVRPDYLNNLAWDAILVVVEALQHIGPTATADQVRDYIANLHGWAGTQGMYDFGDREQRGIGSAAIVIDSWDPRKNDFVAVSRPGGIPK